MDFERVNSIDIDITFEGECTGIVTAHYRGMHIGWVEEDQTYGMVFVPYGSFESPIDLRGCSGDTWEELIRSMDTEISGYRDLLDHRVERGERCVV